MKASPFGSRFTVRQLLRWAAAFYLAAVLAPVAMAAAPKVIVRLPYVISRPGHYVLSNSMNYSGVANAISIEADDVDLDLRDYTITSIGDVSQANPTVGIYSNGHRNISVRNGTLRSFFRGMWLEGVDDVGGHVVENVRADLCTFLGIQVKGRGSVVRNNRVTSVGGSTSYLVARYGIHITGSGIHVAENDVVNVIEVPGQLAFGMYIEGPGCVIERNRVTHSDVPGLSAKTTGIYVHGDTSIIVGNSVTRYATAFVIRDSLGPVLRDNSATGCSWGYDEGGSSFVSGGANY